MAKKKVKPQKGKWRSIFLLIAALGAMLLIPFLMIFLVTLFEVVVGLFGYNYIISEGNRVGQVYKLSEKGLVWKTWEAEMGLTQSGAYAISWEFSIDNESPNKEELIKEITDAYINGSIVRVEYKGHLGKLPWRSHTSYTIEDIEVVQKERPQLIQPQ